MGLTFRKAEKRESRLRLALAGPSGSGKTYTGLAIGTALGRRLAVIDTEHGSASKYADKFSFDVLNLDPPYAPENYSAAIKVATDAGYDVVLIDSLSHEWNGEGGVLQIVDDIARRQKTANSFGAWKEATPRHMALVESMLRAPAHVIVTMRSKQEYVLEDDGKGKKQVTKRGMAPVQRDGIEYEFDLLMDIDHEHVGVVSKSRCSALADKVVRFPGADIATALKEWLSGEPAVDDDPLPASMIPKASEVVEPFSYIYRIAELANDRRLPAEWRERLSSRTEWTEEEAQHAIATCEKKLKEVA